MKIKILSLALVSLIPFITFGHVSGYFGWLTAFNYYGCIYFLFGAYKYRFQGNNYIYSIIVLAPLLYYPLFLYQENNNYFYPGVTPAILLTGMASYIFGLLMPLKKVVSILTMCVVLFGNFLWCKHYVPNIFVNKQINNTNLAHIKDKRIELNFQDLSGRKIDTQVFRNKTVVLDFLFTECVSCINKLSHYNQIQKHFAGDSELIIAAVILGNVNTKSNASTFVETQKYSFPVFYDSAGVFAKKYNIGVNGYPVELRLSKDGYVRETVVGFVWKDSEEAYENQTIEEIKLLKKR